MRSHTAFAIAAALAAAVLYAVSSVLQHRAARQSEPEHAMDVRLLLRLIRHRTWLVGQVADTVGTLFNAVALGLGALSLVQPIISSGVLIAVPLDGAMDRRRPSNRALLAAAVGTAGLIAFVAAATPSEGSRHGHRFALQLTFGICLIAVGALVFTAQHLGGIWRGTLLGAACGIAFADSSALVKQCINLFHRGIPTLITHWPLYALIVIGGLGVVVNQHAFQTRPLQPALLALNLATPIGSSLIGILAFGEKLDTTPLRLTIAVAGAVSMVIGVVASVLVTHEPSAQPAKV